MAQSPDLAKESVPRPRIQTLSDMIFGLALSIGAVTLLTQKPENTMDIAYAVFSFGFSFLILALVWLRYSKVISVLPVESDGIVGANMLLLFLVSVEPYLFNLMITSSYAPPLGQLNLADTTTLYALDLGALQIILAYFMHELAVEERHLIPRGLLRGYKLMMYTTMTSATIFLISALPVFWGIVVLRFPTVPLRLIVWNGVWISSLVRRVDVRMTKQKSNPP